MVYFSVFFFINSTLSPTNTICHSPEDLKCRLKLHIGIKSIKQHTLYHCLDQKILCCPIDKSSSSIFKLSTVTFYLRDSVFKAADVSASFPSVFEALQAFPWCFSPTSGARTREPQANPLCSTRGYKTLGSYWLFRNVFLLLIIFMYNIWRDTICVFDLDISLASYLNNNLKNILQSKRTLFIWMSFIIILLYFIPYY